MTSINHVYFIAEAGVNHNGSIELAKQLVDCATNAGADAIKFQSFLSNKIASKSASTAEYQASAVGKGTTQLEMLQKLELTESMHRELIDYAVLKKIDFMSTAFDQPSFEMLTELTDLPYIKVASGEITNAPLVLNFARTQKPIILSTGMSTLGDIEEALGVIAFGYVNPTAEPQIVEDFSRAYSSALGQSLLRERVILLHCTSAYPTPYSDVNLRAMQTLSAAFGLKVGLSDHTRGAAVSIAAVALGAMVIEKHFTLDLNLEGPDHQMSMLPNELTDLIRSIREVEVALGNASKVPTLEERHMKTLVRKGMVASKRIESGECFSWENIENKRPEGKMSPSKIWQLIGLRASKTYEEDEPIDE